MDTIQKGKFTELQCQLDFTKLGYIVSEPILPCRYDFLVDLGNHFIRIQCKSAHSVDEDNTAITFECRSTRGVKQGQYDIHRKYLESEIDYFYTYFNNQGYLIPVTECSARKTLRFTSINKNKNICWASDYEIEKVIEEVSR